MGYLRQWMSVRSCEIERALLAFLKDEKAFGSVIIAKLLIWRVIQQSTNLQFNG